MIDDEIDHRLKALTDWAISQLNDRSELPKSGFKLTSASDDASFRRYFRGTSQKCPYVFMDAPPELEDCAPFIEIAIQLIKAGVNVPEIHVADHDQGFIMLADFGNTLYLDVLANREPAEVKKLYTDATSMLLRIQQASLPLLPYSAELLMQEMSLFPEWFCDRQLGLILSTKDLEMLQDVFDLLIENAIQQPQVTVHRDYHSRNLMVVPDQNPGVLDFQDAVVGPITYDLVSLYRDCYIRWPDTEIYGWLENYRADLVAQGITDADAHQFREWFDLMGLQRHIKVAGIFSRLNLRDGKPRYLGDVPLVVDYIRTVAARYDRLQPFADWIEEVILPAMTRAGIPPL